MNEEMIKAAYKLQEAARDYRGLYEKENGNKPVVWLKNDKTGEGIFISDGFNTEIIKNKLNMY